MTEQLQPQPPAWVADAVFYQIFPDRFARSDRLPLWARLEPWDAPPTREGFKGGDLWGVLHRLDHLSDLGVTAIYFNPVFQSAANHRYHTHDYYAIDPLLGGDAAFAALLREAHHRGMRVVLDGVFNHASRGFFPFHHLLENGPRSPYADWFVAKGFPLNAYSGKPNYEAWWGLPALPKLNTDRPEVREFLWEVGEHWVRRGVDGWRLDVPEEIKHERFWPEFRRRVKAANPEAYLVGEIWGEAAPWLRGDRFDGVMNYVFTRAALGFFGGVDLQRQHRPGGYALQTLDAPTFARHVEHLLGIYPWAATLAQLNLLSSHDTPRFLTMVNEQRERLKLATLFQMCYPGAPCIYYGDEVGLTGGPDPDCRKGMPWEGGPWDEELLTWFQGAVALRRSHAALRHGDYITLHADGAVYALARRLDDELLVAAFNLGTAPAQLDLPLPPSWNEGRLHDRWPWGSRRREPLPVADGWARALALRPMSARVLLAERPTHP
ncbi:MAG: DUF3459 domain-containing protein [Chloroflexi bacterium]|nr:DUF3459 domain-containing protein [Chloroflexota bacterium]